MAVNYMPFIRQIIGDDYGSDDKAEECGRIAAILSMFEEALLRDLQKEAEGLMKGFNEDKT